MRNKKELKRDTRIGRERKRLREMKGKEKEREMNTETSSRKFVSKDFVTIRGDVSPSPWPVFFLYMKVIKNNM